METTASPRRTTQKTYNNLPGAGASSGTRRYRCPRPSRLLGEMAAVRLEGLGEEGAFPGCGKAQGGMAGTAEGCFKKAFLKSSLETQQGRRRSWVSPPGGEAILSSGDRSVIPHPAPLRAGTAAPPGLQRQRRARGTGTTPASHRPPGGQDPTPHPGWQRSRV